MECVIDWLINSEKDNVSGSLPSVMGTGSDGTVYQTPKSTNGVNAMVVGPYGLTRSSLSHMSQDMHSKIL